MKGNKAQQQQESAQAASSGNAPTHSLYHVEDRGEGEKSFWSEIGVGWVNKDGSINLRTKTGALLLPDHSYQLRARTEKQD